MASTASPLHSVPSPAPADIAGPTSGPASRALPRVPVRVSAARGNHPAGRALPRPAVGRVGESLATVVPLRRAGAVVVPLRAGTPRVAPGDPGRAGEAARGARLRLTRRGRVVLGGLGVVAALGVAAVVGPVLDGADPALELAGQTSVVVHSGDTLWSIAESVAPDTDPRAVVDALRELNGLADLGLVPGQVLILP